MHFDLNHKRINEKESTWSSEYVEYEDFEFDRKCQNKFWYCENFNIY